MTNLKVLKPSVITISDDIADSLVMQASVPISSFMSGSPSARYSAQPITSSKSTKALKPTVSELIQRVAEAQQLMFEPAAPKEVIVFDGENRLNFTGYDTGPFHEVMFGGVNNGKSLIHRCARLFFINTSIYSNSAVTEAFAEHYAESIASVKDAQYPCEAIKIVLEKIIAAFEESSEFSEDSFSGTTIRAIHAANKQIFEEEWYPVLTAERSKKAGIKNFGALMKASPSTLKTVYDTIASVYLSANTDFSVTISQFESLFQMRFVPSQDGTSAGSFMSFSELVEAPSSEYEKEVPILTISMQPGPRKFLVPQGVAVKGVPEPKLYAESVRGGGGSVISWPLSLPENAQVVIIQAPTWIPSNLLPQKFKVDGTNLSFAAQAAAIEAAKAKYDSERQAVIDAVLEVARLFYANMALGDSSASIVTPLNVTWEVGRRYKIRSAQSPDSSSPGEVLFSGFLREVQHRVSSNPSRVEASTQLTFSHIEANGFTLPNF